MSNTGILFALSAAVAIGVLSGGSAAQAGSKDDADCCGGFVVPGSLDGVNPVYHPDIFGNPSAARAYGFVPLATQKRHPKSQHRR